MLQTYSIKDRRGDGSRISKIRPIREPPIITTTAATPQDSPSTTMESGMGFGKWNQNEADAEVKFGFLFVSETMILFDLLF